MKKIIITLAIILPFYCLAYNWERLGPDYGNVKVTNVCFDIGKYKNIALSTPDGLLINNGFCGNGIWLMYPTSLPVWDACPLNDSILLLIQGNGSYSDGIYSFNLNSYQYSVIEYCLYPNFIFLCGTDSNFYSGHQNGIKKSTDGINWTDITYFNNKKCVAMDYQNNNFVVSEVSNLINIYISSDAGSSWTAPVITPPVLDGVKFNDNGVLYGYFGGTSNSSGLYSSIDFGLSWNLEFYSDKISAIGFDCDGIIFTGWQNTLSGTNQGIAIYDAPNGTSGLTFVNTGLVSKYIYNIKNNPIFDCPSIVCCTDSGAYYITDYSSAGITNFNKKEISLKAYPVPANDFLTLECSASRSSMNNSIKIFSIDGKLIKDFSLKDKSENKIKLDLKSFNEGIYYCRFESGNESITKKFIVLD